MTNTERLTQIMEFSKAGPMSQPFIMEAIRKYAEQIIDNEEQIIEQMQTSFICGESWVKTAKIVQQELMEGKE